MPAEVWASAVVVGQPAVYGGGAAAHVDVVRGMATFKKKLAKRSNVRPESPLLEAAGAPAEWHADYHKLARRKRPIKGERGCGWHRCWWWGGGSWVVVVGGGGLQRTYQRAVWLPLPRHLPPSYAHTLHVSPPPTHTPQASLGLWQRRPRRR
jgi:hypothetical protein